jgi:hypothetical protein
MRYIGYYLADRINVIGYRSYDIDCQGDLTPENSDMSTIFRRGEKLSNQTSINVLRSYGLKVPREAGHERPIFNSFYIVTVVFDLWMSMGFLRRVSSWMIRSKKYIVVLIDH